MASTDQETKSGFMFKILGRQLQWELTNDKIIEKLDTLIEEWLNKVNTISLSGCVKSWIVDMWSSLAFLGPYSFMISHSLLYKIGQIDVLPFAKMAENEQMC